MIKRPLTLAPKALSTAPPNPPAESRGPVAWWHLDEPAGTTAADAAQPQQPARVHGAARWRPGEGRYRGALELPGCRSYVDCGDYPEFDLRAAIAISMWMKADGPSHTTQTLAAKGSTGWQLQCEPDTGRLVFRINGPDATGKDRGKSTQLRSSGSVRDGQWHHLLGVYDGRQMTLWLDGRLEGSLNASGSLTINTEPLWLGNNSSEPTQAFGGWLDDVRVYDRGISPEEIMGNPSRPVETTHAAK